MEPNINEEWESVQGRVLMTVKDGGKEQAKSKQRPQVEPRGNSREAGTALAYGLRYLAQLALRSGPVFPPIPPLLSATSPIALLVAADDCDA